MMKYGSFCVAILLLCMSMPAVAEDQVEPVRMGCGLMTFDTVPGWGLRPTAIHRWDQRMVPS